MIEPRSSTCSSNNWCQRYSKSLRSAAVFARQDRNACSAWAMARAVSWALKLGTRPMMSPVAGLSTVSVSPLSASSQSPPTKLRSLNSSGVRSSTLLISHSLMSVFNGVTAFADSALPPLLRQYFGLSNYRLQLVILRIQCLGMLGNLHHIQQITQGHRDQSE